MKMLFKWALIIAIGGSAYSEVSQESKKNAAAIINDHVISRDEVLGQLKQLAEQAKQKGENLPEGYESKAYEVILEEMIKGHVIEQVAKNSGVEKDSEFQEELKKLKERFIVKYFLNKEQEKIIRESITKEKVESLMNKLKEQEKQIVFQQMVVSDAEKAERIKKAVEVNKKAFSSYIKEYNIDKKNETEIGPVAEFLLPGGLRKQVAELKPGNILIIAEDNNPNGKKRLLYLVKREKLTDPQSLQQIAQAQLMSEASKKLMKDFYSKVKIERFDMQGNPMKEPELRP